MASEFVVFGRAAKRRSVRKGKVSKLVPRIGKARIAISTELAGGAPEDGRDFFDYRKPGLRKLASKKSEMRWKKVRAMVGMTDTDGAPTESLRSSTSPWRLQARGERPGARQKCLT